MKKIFYEKVGRKYIPVQEYDSQLLDALPKGAHLVCVYPGGQSTRYNVDPAYAPLIAASRAAEDALAQALVRAGEMRLQVRERERNLTEAQRAAWENLIKVFGEGARQLEWPSAREVAEEGMKALREEAESLLTHESVKKAYDHLILISKLVKKDMDEKTC